jgi:hypothetical protein
MSVTSARVSPQEAILSRLRKRLNGRPAVDFTKLRRRGRIRGVTDHFDRITMVNYILLYKIKKKVKATIKEKLALGELATTPSSCLDCLATDLSWEMYYLMKEKEED